MNLLKAALLTATAMSLGCSGMSETAMFEDVRSGNAEKVRAFLDAGGNVNAMDDPGNTPLHCAANEDHQGSHTALIKLLLARGANVNATDDLQATPLHMASNKETAAILLEAGADVNAKNREGRTVLFRATHGAVNANQFWEQQRDFVQLLIDKGANVNAADGSGKTVLHDIAGSYDQQKTIEICELLIQNGAKVNQTDKAGRTPLDVALSEQRTETGGLLEKHGGKTSHQLTTAKSE